MIVFVIQNLGSENLVWGLVWDWRIEEDQGIYLFNLAWFDLVALA